MLRYEVHQAMLKDIPDYFWVPVKRAMTERGLRKKWWREVQRPRTEQAIFRMFDTKTGEVVEP